MGAVQQERRLARKRGRDNSEDDVPATSLATRESYWINIETHERGADELYDFLRQLRLPPFFVSILSEPSAWTSEVIALREASLIVFQIIPADPDGVETQHVALLSMPRLLVTFSAFSQRSGDAGGFHALMSQYLKERGRVPEPSSSGILLAWLQFHVRRTARAVRALRLVVSETSCCLFCILNRPPIEHDAYCLMLFDRRPWRWTRELIRILPRLNSNNSSKRKNVCSVSFRWRRSRMK